MENKLPKVYANKIEKPINNNATVFYGNHKEKITSTNERDELQVLKKINQIFASSRYVYKADVVITLIDKQIIKKVIGRNKKELITMDNEVIDIDNILDIEFKK